MKTITIIAGVAVAALLGLGAWWWLLQGEPAPVPVAQDPFRTPQSQVTVRPTETGGAKKSITIRGEGMIEVNDFMQDPQTKGDPVNAGQYFLGNYIDPTSPDAPAVPYAVTFIDATSYFNIALLAEPIDEARTEAEAYLQKQLGITPGQMCQLKYMVSVPVRVNQTYAGQNLGFSFCPGATPL